MKAGLLALVLACVAVSCAGASSHVVAPTSRYPISLSGSVRDADGKLVADARKEQIAEFKYDYRAWGWLWTLVSFTGDKDISEAVNEQVTRAGGEAVTNLYVRSYPCGWNYFTLLGVLPDCANVSLRGRIIRVRR